jgi:hypothetical protein
MKIAAAKSPHSDVTVGAYDPHVYDGLLRFHSSKRLLKQNYTSINHIGQTFVKHGVHESFGLNLLHKHFDMSDDEFLHRSFNRAGSSATMRPTKVAAFDDAVPYLWRAVRADGDWRFLPLEFVRRSDVGPGTVTDLDGQTAFLGEFADRLDELGAIDLFGLATFNIFKIPVGEDDLLLETTDAATRTLTVRAEPRAKQPLEELTETLWNFTLPEEDHLGHTEEDAARSDPALGCTGTHCAGHCRNHCLSHCVGHCTGHTTHPV